MQFNKDAFYLIYSIFYFTFLVGKYFGGVWIGGYGCLDGHKFVCLDDLYEDVLNNRCLIYSFGINNEWSFEENMISMGCTIRSFDPTIDGSSKPKTDLVTFQKIGLADQPRVDGIGEVSSFNFSVLMITKNSCFFLACHIN